MVWRLTLAVAVVCIGGMCSCVETDLMSRLLMPRDYGVKLCGREFIRAVIFTCGGSRWRRSTEGDLDSSQWSFLGEVTEGSNQHVGQRGVQFTDPLSPLHALSTPSLTDLLSFYADVSDTQQPSDSSQMKNSQPTVDLTEQEENPRLSDRSVVNKKKRNFSLGVAGMCCTQGCTKYDIGRLC